MAREFDPNKLPGRFPSASRRFGLLLTFGLATGCSSVPICEFTSQPRLKDKSNLVPTAVEQVTESTPTGKHIVAKMKDLPVEVASNEIPMTLPPESIGIDGQTAILVSMADDSLSAPHTLDFATALALVAGENPQVAFAQERVNEAFARWESARVLWLPSLRAGASYNKHEGRIQEVGGNVFDVSRGSAYSGFGSQAVGTGSPAVSGVSAQFHVADAIFQPIIAERNAAALQQAANATTNDVLLDAALAYLELTGAIQTKQIADETVKNARELANQTATFAKTGQGPQADADRVQTELSLRQNDLARAEEAVQVASARLAEVLSLDASLDIRPAEPTVTPIELAAVDSPLNDLVATALSNRPELSESRLLVSAAIQRLKRECYSPFIPSVLLGLSYGGFGGGQGGDVRNYHDRLDFDAVAYWEVRNLGLGERAARHKVHAQVHQAQQREIQTMDQVAREVAEAYAQVKSRKQQIAVAQKGIQSADDSYRRNLERIRQGQGLPIEVLQAIQALDQIRREYLRAVTDYNSAQFRLHRALGWPIHE